MRPLPPLLALAAAVLLAPAVRADGWKAGVARAVITPTTPMWMAGYASRNKPAEGKYSELWVKALAMEDASGRRAVLVTLDLCGIDRDTSVRIRDRLLRDYQLGREAVALASTHTHSGPMAGQYLRAANLLDDSQQAASREYTAKLEDKVVATVGEAIAALAPAKLSWAVGQATFAVNRRNNPERQVPALRAKGELKGPVDHDLPVLSITAAADGKPLAIVFGYACHATTTALYEWSGDWPGVAAAEIETAHPGATAMCWIGCGGDQNPLPRGNYDRLREYGRHAASAVEKAIESGSSKPIDPAASLAMSYGEIDLPFAPLPTKEQLEANAKSENKFEANRARILLGKLRHEGRLSPHYAYPVQVWRLGDGLKWVFLGGEVVVDYSLRLKRELGPTDTWVAAYTNDVMAYIPSLRVLNEGRYEGEGSMVYYALPTKWAPAVEELIVKEVHRQVGELAKGN